jgi:hypothetical protein
VTAPTLTGAEAIRAALADAARAVGGPDDVDVVLERPRDPAFGDWTTNLAMTLARPLRQKPREIADALIARMDLAGAGVRAAEVAGAGFINFRLDPAFVARGSRPSSSRATPSAATRRGRASAWSSSSSRPTPRGRCTSATGARPRWATRSRRCSPGRGGR